MAQTFLVTGAAGQLGQRVIAQLLGAYRIAPTQLVVTTRDPSKLASLAAQGVKVRKADFEDGDSLIAAFAGVDRLLLISTDAIHQPGQRLAQHLAAVAAARKAGVKHVVYTSMPNPETSLVSFAPDHLGTEQALAASGLGWTILRNNWYMENLFLNLPSVLATGKWFTATGEGRVAHISREDCARAAAAALVAESSTNARYDITGPEKHTTAEIAAIISEVKRKPIEVIPVTDEQLAQGLEAANVPAFLVPLLVSIDANTRAGKLDMLSNAVETLTGKAPQTLREFLIENPRSPQAT